jgi:hypothetical protein
MEGEKMRSHRRGFLKLKHLSPLKMLTSPLFEETFGAFLFLFPFLSLSLSLSALSLDDLGVSMILEEKSLIQKLLFNWLQYTGGGRIFRSGCMHANIYGLG